jgi:hypothetical protein
VRFKWYDDVVGSPVSIDIDLGAIVAVDTVYLGYTIAAADASWTINAGAEGYMDQVLKDSGALRVFDRAGRVPARTHAFWTGAVANVRFLRLTLYQPSGSAALSAGILMVGRSWRPAYNIQFGGGRRVIDTGTVAALPDGGFGTVEGVRKREFSWTLGDLSSDEIDSLEDLVLDHGETNPVLVVEQPDAAIGQRAGIHYGLFVALKAFERKNAAQTAQQFVLEEWI